MASDGPKTNRWRDRATWLHSVAARRGVEAMQNAAWKALSHFTEAQDLRRCYRACKKVELLNQAAKEHRRGVKAYNEACILIFGERHGRNQPEDHQPPTEGQ